VTGRVTPVLNEPAKIDCADSEKFSEKRSARRFFLSYAKYRASQGLTLGVGAAEGLWCGARNLLFPGIVALRRLDRTNIGDWRCSPFQYFQADKPVYDLDIEREPANLSWLYANAPVVIGGGGLYYFDEAINRLGQKHRAPIVGWSIGKNSHFGGKPNRLDESRFALLGVRDWGTDNEWVPCVSCMAPDFDALSAAEPQHEVVVYEHKDHPLHLPGLPVLTNHCLDLPKVLRFLASGSVVITNSYHGAYWAQLLGRRVVAVAFSDRFLGFRFPLTLANRRNALDLIDEAQSYPSALEISRQRNREFAAKVSQRLGVTLVAPRSPASIRAGATVV
jgi:hypothetical protein